MSDPVLEALAKALSPYMSGAKASGAQAAAGTYLYESGGLFGRCDGPNTLINAMVGPIGFEKYLTWIGTDTEKEFVDAWKAIEETGSEQSTGCGDCVRIRLKACAQFYCFGRFCRQTDELQFDRLGVRANQNVPVRTLFGAVTDDMGNVLIPMGAQITDAFAIQSRAVGYSLRLKNGTMLWNGNPQNNTDDTYMEYKGFQLVVNTGKYDAYTDLSCDSIDSFLMNFAYNNPTADGAYAIRQWFHRMVGQLKYRAERAGLDWDSSTMYIVMSQNMWDCVSRVYACAGTDLCSVSGQNRIVINADQAQARYEEYLSSMMLPVDGKMYPVVIDNLIPETAGQANGTCSDIYFITTEIDGETITYGQYQDFNMTYGRTRQELVSLFGSDDIAITDGGRYALVRDNSRGCFDVQAYTKPRVVAKAPWLAGRIQNVCCNVLQEPYPDVTGSGRVYEKDGGRYTTPVPTLYGDCPDC